MSVENDPQFQLLFKQFNNTVNTRQDLTFSDGNNAAPFRNYVFNDAIFSNNIPSDLRDISFGAPPNTVYGLAALDASFNSLNKPFDSSYNIPGTDLTFYYRQELQFTNATTNRTYWIDASNNNSALADSIPFNYDRSQYNSYEPRLYDKNGSQRVPIFDTGAPGIKWLMDYKSGFVQFYGTDDDVNTWAGNFFNPINSPPRLSYIKYTGPKGASGAGGGNDASFNGIDISGISLMNIQRFRFTSDNSNNTFLPTTGSPSGYYKIAIVDDMRKIKTNNLAETLTQGTFMFFTRVNFEDNNTSQKNRLQWNASFTIGVNQSDESSVFPYPESFINTNYCLVQQAPDGNFPDYKPFESLHIIKNTSTKKYELYLKFNKFFPLNKYIDLTIVLQPGNENNNPISSKFDNSASNDINWQLEPLTSSPPSSLPFPSRSSLSLTLKSERRSWSGTMLPFIGESAIASYGNALLRKHTIESFNRGNKRIASCFITEAANSKKRITPGGLFKFYATYETGGVVYTQETRAYIELQVTGTNAANAAENCSINVLSNITSVDGGNLFDKVKVMRVTQNSQTFSYEVQLDLNSSIVAIGTTPDLDLNIELSQNKLNPLDQRSPGDKESWVLNMFGGGSSSNRPIIKSINLGTARRDATNWGNQVIDANTDSAGSGSNISKTGGGLDIYNSGGSFPNTLSYPQLRLIPYIHSAPRTLGNETTLSVNSDNATTFQGSGTLSIYNGQKNFGSFNIYQGDGSTTAASNVIHSNHEGSNKYVLSFNHSRNDTDVAINTPTYNILTNDPQGNTKPKNPAMIADSGDNEIRFNAPVVFNNDASFNAPVVFNNDVFGDSIALMEKFTFDTTNLSVNDWVTIAKTGTGNTRSLRSDAKFIIEDRQGSHHQSIIFQAGAKYSSGVYIDVEQSSWFAKYKFQALRIAHGGTYDGSVLQAQLTSDPSGVSVSPVTVRIYQNRNSEGWVCDLSGSPSSDNSPKVYVTDPSNSGLNAQYPFFTPDISGINIVSPDPNNRNSVQTTTSNFIVDSGVFEVKNSPEINLECIGNNGNIILDTSGGIVPGSGGVPSSNKGIIAVADNNIYFQANNKSQGSSAIQFKQHGVGQNNFIKFTVNNAAQGIGGTDYDLKWSIVGLNLGGQPINDVGSGIYGPQTRSAPMELQADSGLKLPFLNYLEAQPINCGSAFKMMNLPTTEVKPYLLDSSGTANVDDGTLLYDETNNFLAIRRNSEVWGLTSPLKETYTISLGAKNYKSTTSTRRITSGSMTSPGDGLTHGHPGAIGVDLQLQTPITSSSNGTLICSTILAHEDVYIRNIIVRGYGHKLNYYNTTNADRQVTFETWLVTGPAGGGGGAHDGSYYFYPNSGQFPAEPCPSEIRDLNNLGSNVLQLASHTRLLFKNSGSSPTNLQYPFSSSSYPISPQNIDVVALNNNAPFKIPKGNTYHIVMIERIVPNSSGNNPITSGALTFDEYTTTATTTTMENVVPFKFEIYGEINYLS